MAENQTNGAAVTNSDPNVHSVSYRTNQLDDSGKAISVRATFRYDLPLDLKGLISKLGEEQVASLCRQQAIIRLQATARQLLVAGFTQDKLQEHMDGFKIGERAPGAVRVGDPVKAVMDNWDSLSEERQKEILAAIQAKAKAK